MYSRYVALYAAYAVAALLWLLLAQLRPAWWSVPTRVEDRSGTPLRHVALSVLGILVIGQMYGAGLLFPESGAWRTTAEAVNQLVIFAPAFVAVWWTRRRVPREHRRALTGIPFDFIAPRLAAGCAVALVAMLVYVTAYSNAAPALTVLGRVLAVENIPLAAQVFGEDIAILLALCAIASRFSPRVAIVTVAVLFSAAHIPAMLQRGEAWSAAIALIGDAGLTLIVAGAVLRTRDLWILWPVHSVLDAMQFHAGM